jgi:anthranilate synthase component 1
MRACLKPIDGCTDLLDLHALEPARYPFLLESSGGVPELARYDILFAFPGRVLTLDSGWQLAGGADSGAAPDFLRALDALWRQESVLQRRTADLPFHGGWFVFLGYELAQQIEPGLRLSTEPGMPVAQAVRVPGAVVRDRRAGVTYAFAEAGQEHLLRAIEADVLRLGSSGRRARREPVKLIAESVLEADPREFLYAVEAAQHHIRAGDVYQANISRRWEGRIGSGVEAWMLYDRLRRANPAPFSGLAVMDGVTIISSSPERLLRVRDGRAETRPIAGTRPRRDPGKPEHERRLGLVENPKERAEHVMLIDLERNDLGRVCTAGSVQVDDFMAVESYAHVHHIVSNVSGIVRSGTSPGDVLRAVFPGGTITGCPKVRCMSIIRDLEGRPRGAYTGAMGYLNHDGSCDFNILIRTMTLTGDRLLLSAGSGIVADSIPERELAETRAKAKGMLLAVTD